MIISKGHAKLRTNIFACGFDRSPSFFSRLGMNPILHILLGGMLGGLVGGFNSPALNELRVPKLRLSDGRSWPAVERIEFGFFGDCITGAAASVAILLFAVSFGIDLAASYNLSGTAKILSLGVVSGFAGRKLLDNLAQIVSSRVEALEKEQTEIAVKSLRENTIAEYLREAKYNLAIKNYAQALTLFDKVLAIEASNKFALNGRAACLIYAGSDARRNVETKYDLPVLEQAFELLTRVIREHPKFEPAVYNRAWARNEIRKATEKSPGGPRYSIEDIAADLELAFRIDPSGTSYIATDEEFKDIVANPLIKAIIDKAKAIPI